MSTMTIIPREGDFEDDTVTIPIDEYLYLTDQLKILTALYMEGVHDWEGYGEAMKRVVV